MSDEQIEFLVCKHNFYCANTYSDVEIIKKLNIKLFLHSPPQAKAATGYYKEAEELLGQINDTSIRNEHTWSIVLAKCQIYSGHAEKAWNLFTTKDTTPEAFALLQLIANDCYRVGEFWIAARAFDMLEK